MEREGIIVNERWRVGRKVGAGGFGAVYSATDIKSGAEVALKMKHRAGHVARQVGSLDSEARAFRGVHAPTRGGKRGIPLVHWDGEDGDYYVMVTDLLGPSLEDLFNYCDGKFGLKTTLLIADQALGLLHTIHRTNWLHRDIKPDNFVMGTRREGHTLYAIDMGVAMEWHRAELAHRISPDGGREWVGTPEFASINCHMRRELSFRDDLESLGYVLLSFLNGRLKWTPRDSEAVDEEKIARMKMEIEIDELCQDAPDEFNEYFKYVWTLDFSDRPDYGSLRKLFRELFNRSGFKNDHVYDWTERIWNDLYPPPPAVQPVDGNAGA